MASENCLFQGIQGNIDTCIDWPESTEIAGWCLMLHPHPLYDGTRDNKVVTTVARSVVSQNFVCIRPNFRGVGASEGTFDQSNGESEDMLLLIEQFAQKYPEIYEKKGIVAGFSFGSAVAAKIFPSVQSKRPSTSSPIGLILIGTAVVRFTVPEVSEQTLVIHGELDETIPLTQVLDWARPQELPVVIVPGADHFFHKKLVRIKKLVIQYSTLLGSETL